MLASVVLSIYLIYQNLNWSLLDFINSAELKKFDKIIVNDSFLQRNHFIKSFMVGFLLQFA